MSFQETLLDARGASETIRYDDSLNMLLILLLLSHFCHSRTDQPDVVASARHSARAQSELIRGRDAHSPPLDELNAILQASQLD
uniref:Uncharacterized protein n=1 Tax=Heterorhabditis bacteriophora TaxID=37862 RepID=A0A1I7XE05_HETBA